MRFEMFTSKIRAVVPRFERHRRRTQNVPQKGCKPAWHSVTSIFTVPRRRVTCCVTMNPEAYSSYKPECRLFATSTHGRSIVVNWQFACELCFTSCKEFGLLT